MISNLGSFGDRVVKIGMTRRLELMDRVRELGDTSVPFRFDLHALFFSEDAVGIETALHQEFADRRVVDTIRASQTRTARSVRLSFGRWICRQATSSCLRKRAFSRRISPRERT